MPSASSCFLPTVSGSLDIKYCSSSSSNSNSGSGGRDGDGELMQQGSGRPAGGVVSCSKPVASSKPAATAAGALRRVALLGACGWQDKREELPHPHLVFWGQDPSCGEGGDSRGEERSWTLADSDSNLNRWEER